MAKVLKRRKVLAFFMSVLMILGAVNVGDFHVRAAGATPTSGNIYYIKNKNSGMYLTVQGDSSSNGANVCQATGTGSLGQRWILEKNANGTFRLHPATDMTGGVSLDVAYGSTSGGTNIQIWQNNGLSPQNFGIKQSGDGYVITTEVTGHASCLDVNSASKSSGANVIQWTNKNSANQIWYFEEAQWPSTGSSGSSSGGSSSGNSGSSNSGSSNSGSTSTTTSSKSWNMSDTNFRSLGTINSTKTIDGLKLVATSSKTMSVTSSAASLNGTTYNYCLALGGAGSTSYRAAAVSVSGTSKIKVTAKSSGTATRTLAFVNDSGQQIGTMSCGASLSTGEVSVTGTGTIYIYSTGSGINIYKIQVDSTGSGSSSSSGSTSSGNTSSGSTNTSGNASNISSAIDANGYPDQLMEFVSTSDGAFVTASSSSANAAVKSSTTSSTANRWKLVKKGSDYYQIINAAGGYALAPSGNSASNGRAVVTASVASNNAQYWKISAVKTDCNGDSLNYKIVNYANTNLALTLSNGSYTLSSYSGSAAQNFRLNSHGAEGFAGYSKNMSGKEKASITGGALGEVVYVSNVNDLQKYASGSTAYTIVINANISSNNLTKVTVGKNKTFVGKFGAGTLNNIHFRCISNSGNVIFKNITFKHDASKNENDDIQMYISNGNNFWVDHCTFSGHSAMTSSDVDKHMYVGLKADFVSVTGCYFGGHKYGLILGYPNEDGAGTYSGYPRMTIANNYFYNNYTRAPGLMRYGNFHCYNNYVYGFNLGYTPYTGCDIYSEKNYFEKGSYAGRVVDDHGVGNFTDSGSVLTSSVSGLKTGGTSWRPSSNYGYSTRSAADAKTWAQRFAGAQSSKIVYAID